MLTQAMLTQAEFEDLLDLHGADLTRWPTHLAARAGMLMGASAAARAAWADAEMVALSLNALYPERSVDPTRLAAAVRLAARTPQAHAAPALRLGVIRGPWRQRVTVAVRAGALAASLLLGATLGWNASDHGASASVDLAELVDLDIGGL